MRHGKEASVSATAAECVKLKDLLARMSLESSRKYHASRYLASRWFPPTNSGKWVLSSLAV